MAHSEYEERLLTEIERLRTALREWEECARYDPDMSGRAVFKEWNFSALDRCRRKMEAARDAPPPPSGERK